MKPKPQKKDPAKKSRWLFCGLSRGARSPDTSLSRAPPQNAIPVSIKSILEQPRKNGNEVLHSSVARLPPNQDAAPQLLNSIPVSIIPVVQQPRKDESPLASGAALPHKHHSTVHFPEARHSLQDDRSRYPDSNSDLSNACTWEALPFSDPEMFAPKALPPSVPSSIPPRPRSPKLGAQFFFRLMDLPREIRDLIWLHKLRDHPPPLSLPINQIRKALPAICHITRRVFNETVPLFLKLISIEIRDREHVRRLFQFLDHVPNEAAYLSVRTIIFQDLWPWTSATAIPILNEVLLKCNRVQDITLVITPKFLYEPIYYTPPESMNSPPNRREYREQYIKTHLFPDLDHLFVCDATNLRTVRVCSSPRYDALSVGLNRMLSAELWLDYLDMSGSLSNPRGSVLEMGMADWKEELKRVGGECSQWLEQLLKQVLKKTKDSAQVTATSTYRASSYASPTQAHKQTYDTTRFSTPSTYSSSHTTSPTPDSSADSSFAHIPLFSTSSPRRGGQILYDTSDYYAASGFEEGSYEASGYEGIRSPDRPSGYWSSGVRYPAYRPSRYNIRPGFIGPGL